MQKQTKGNSFFERTNFKPILFFLSFSLVIWVLVQFSKTYEEIIHVPISYSKTPKDKIISDKTYYLDIKLKKSGFGIMWFSLFKDQLSIDLSNLPGNAEEKLVFSVKEHSKSITKKLGLNLEEVKYMDDEIIIPYRLRASKLLPVEPRIRVDFEAGYGSANQLQLVPDTIKVSGPQALLDSLKVLKTVPLEIKKVNGDLKGSVALDISTPQLSPYQKKVSYFLDVEKFTEGRLEIPVQIINLPKNTKVTIFPKTITAIFQVGLKDYKDITTGDFKIVCNYDSLEMSQGFFIPKVKNKPEIISKLRLGTNKIQFVIKK